MNRNTIVVILDFFIIITLPYLAKMPTIAPQDEGDLYQSGQNEISEQELDAFIEKAITQDTATTPTADMTKWASLMEKLEQSKLETAQTKQDKNNAIKELKKSQDINTSTIQKLDDISSKLSKATTEKDALSTLNSELGELNKKLAIDLANMTISKSLQSTKSQSNTNEKGDSTGSTNNQKGNPGAAFFTNTAKLNEYYPEAKFEYEDEEFLSSNRIETYTSRIPIIKLSNGAVVSVFHYNMLGILEPLDADLLGMNDPDPVSCHFFVLGSSSSSFSEAAVLNNEPKLLILKFDDSSYTQGFALAGRNTNTIPISAPKGLWVHPEDDNTPLNKEIDLSLVNGESYGAITGDISTAPGGLILSGNKLLGITVDNSKIYILDETEILKSLQTGEKVSFNCSDQDAYVTNLESYLSTINTKE